MFGGELWGVHPRAAYQRKQTAARYAQHLKALVRVPKSTPTRALLLELGALSLHDRWLQCAVRFWNRLLDLPADELHRNVLYDSVVTNIGFARGLRSACREVGWELDVGGAGPSPHRLNCDSIMKLCRAQQFRAMELAADVDPRSCPTSGAMFCTYWRWFRRTDMQAREQRRLRSDIFSLPVSAVKVNTLLRFRLGCLAHLPIVQGRYRNVPRAQRFCPHCPGQVGDEKHLIFDCTAFWHLRHQFSALFVGQSCVRGFVNQESQRDVLHFICGCVSYSILLMDVLG